MGRCIGHKDDYGAIVLLDARFAELRMKTCLSRWVLSHLHLAPSFAIGMQSLSAFYAACSAQPLGPLREVDRNAASVAGPFSGKAQP